MITQFTDSTQIQDFHDDVVGGKGRPTLHLQMHISYSVG